MASSAGAERGTLAWAIDTDPASRLMAVAAATASVRTDAYTARCLLGVGPHPGMGPLSGVRRHTLPQNLTDGTHIRPLCVHPFAGTTATGRVLAGGRIRLIGCRSTAPVAPALQSAWARPKSTWSPMSEPSSGPGSAVAIGDGIGVRGGRTPPHVRRHQPSRRGQVDADRGAVAARAGDRPGRRGARQGRAALDGVGLDGDGAGARHLHQLVGAAVHLPRHRPEPGGHPRARRLLRGHLPRADRRGQRGDAPGRRQGPGAPDDEAVRGVPQPRRADRHGREQVGPSRA